ncbi:hypothetical protein H0H81_010463 [Sphagnurus paluster]|uniref:Uncharacterized protein n=1 Tax=Sphagnurus paluster TaxID=117069 RepID=A0A9P7GSL4_9AGAR|nr:hypothetical protein H0H81_010463 [Sphagnurus paluster]
MNSIYSTPWTLVDASYDRAGPSTTPKTPRESKHRPFFRAAGYGWQADSYGSIHYVELPSFEDHGELDLEAGFKRPRATRALHAHMQTPEFEQYAYADVLTDPLPEDTSPPPTPLISEYLSMPSACATPMYRQAQSYKPSAFDEPKDLLAFSSPPQGCCSPLSVSSQTLGTPYIPQPQPRRVIRIDLLEMYKEVEEREDPHSATQEPNLNLVDVRDVTSYCGAVRSDLPRYHDRPESPLKALQSTPKISQRASRRRQESRLSTPDSGYESGATLESNTSSGEDTSPRKPQQAFSRQSSSQPQPQQIKSSATTAPQSFTVQLRSVGSKNSNPPTSVEAVRALNLVNATLKRLHETVPDTEELEVGLLAAQSCLRRQRSLSPEEWGVHSESWIQKYLERVQTIERLTLWIDGAIGYFDSHRRVRIHESENNVCDQLFSTSEQLMELSSKLEDSFDRLQSRHIQIKAKSRTSSHQVNGPKKHVRHTRASGTCCEEDAISGSTHLSSDRRVNYPGLASSFTNTMSTAHRPTWDPAQAKDVKGGSRQFSVRDMAAHTKLKFRQHGQTSTDEVKKRDLRAELLAAEQEAKNKKRKAEGKPPLPIEGASGDEEANKRRKLLQEALEMDKDDEDEDGEKDGEEADSDEDDDEDEDEDDTAELLRELEKIKRERAEEKARQEREESATTAAAREAEIATGNPLLNLAAALGQQVPSGLNTTVPGTFSVKRRWDDDLIFKNQAMDTRDKGQGHFVNDLLRTEFHKKFMAKFIK